MIGFPKDIHQEQDQEPRTGRITFASVLVLIAVLGLAIVKQYLSQ
jgi:hypothetical protein